MSRELLEDLVSGKRGGRTSGANLHRCRLPLHLDIDDHGSNRALGEHSRLCWRWGTVKETLGVLNDSVILGGEIINPGDIVAGDADGLVVVRREEIREAARLSWVREDAEAGYIKAYKQGQIGH